VGVEVAGASVTTRVTTGGGVRVGGSKSGGGVGVIARGAEQDARINSKKMEKMRMRGMGELL
jgi:hypothetical protein